MAELISIDEVRHIARLARLALSDAELEQYRHDLAGILEHVSRLREVEVEGVEPMPYPQDMTNRLDDDQVAASLPVDVALSNAPAVEDIYLAVPKVLDEGTG